MLKYQKVASQCVCTACLAIYLGDFLHKLAQPVQNGQVYDKEINRPIDLQLKIKTNHNI